MTTHSQWIIHCAGCEDNILVVQFAIQMQYSLDYSMAKATSLSCCEVIFSIYFLFESFIYYITWINLLPCHIFPLLDETSINARLFFFFINNCISFSPV